MKLYILCVHFLLRYRHFCDTGWPHRMPDFYSLYQICCLQFVSDLLFTITLTFQSFGKIPSQECEVIAVHITLILSFHMYIVYNLVPLNT